MSIEFAIIPNQLQAAKFICELRNDPYVQKMSNHSFHRELHAFFHYEFVNRYVTSEVNLSFFIIYKGKKVGVFALERTQIPTLNTREVSLFISAQYRFRGIGKQTLMEGINIAKKFGIENLIATIKQENEPSKKVFAFCGFEQVDQTNWRLNLHKQNEETLVIAEAGSNWKGDSGSGKDDLKRAFAMIEKAKEAGANFVKFQLFTPSKLYSKNAGKAQYLEQRAPLEMNELFEKYRLPTSFLPQLKQKCDELQIGFLASSFSEEDFLALDPYVSMHKIASYEITHTKLIELAAKSHKPLLLSTGAASLNEIEVAIELFQSHGGKEMTLLQCTAQYPADPYAMNIAALKQLRSRFNLPVGLSDHSIDPLVAPVMAVAFGASVIEKHFTLDRKEKGPDHFFAIEPHELKQMVNAIRLSEKMRFSADKSILSQEKELAHFAKRGLQATKHIKKGDALIFRENMDILRPGNNQLGIHPKHLDQIEGKKVLKDIPIGNGIQIGDINW